jgi:vacuolar-type H+-ATPase subunit I/STV1
MKIFGAEIKIEKNNKPITITQVVQNLSDGIEHGLGSFKAEVLNLIESKSDEKIAAEIKELRVSIDQLAKNVDRLNDTIYDKLLKEEVTIDKITE